MKSKTLNSKKDSTLMNDSVADKAGFTMIEVVVSLVILSTSLVALFAALRICGSASYHNRMQTDAVLLAESLFAQTHQEKEMVFETREGTRNRYQWRVKLAPTPVENLAAVRVTVEWLEQGRRQSYELLSLIHFQSRLEGR